RQLGLPGRLTEAGGYPIDTLAEVLRTCYGCFCQSLQQAALAQRDRRAMQDGMTQAINIMIGVDRDVRANGGRLLVVVLPTRAQAEPLLSGAMQRSMGALLGLNEADLAFEDEVTREVGERLGQAGLAVLPLEPALRSRTQQASSGPPTPLYYSYDWHLNPAGHRAVAEALTRSLGELGLLPLR